MRKMNALICTLLALALAVGLFVLRMPMAYAETFSQMKNSIPETVTFTIDGEPVEVPVILPDVETLPIGYTCPLRIDQEKMRELFGDTIKQVNDGRLVLNVGDPYAQGSSLVFLESGIAPLVDAAPERAGEIFLEIVEKTGLPLEFRVEKTLARAGRYENKEIEISLVGLEKEVEQANHEYFYPSFTSSVPDTTKPIAGMERGAYEAIMVQLANGVPIHPIASPNGGGGFFGPYTYLHMWSETDYAFSFVYASQPCGAGEEPDLASFDTIVKAVQKRIDEGWLRAVDSLELCYGQTARLVKGKSIASKYASESNPNGALVPTWRVNGYDRMHLADRLSNAYEDPTPFERYIQTPPKGYHITYDATTGELWNRKGWEE